MSVSFSLINMFSSVCGVECLTSCNFFFKSPPQHQNQQIILIANSHKKAEQNAGGTACRDAHTHRHRHRHSDTHTHTHTHTPTHTHTHTHLFSRTSYCTLTSVAWLLQQLAGLQFI